MGRVSRNAAAALPMPVRPAARADPSWVNAVRITDPSNSSTAITPASPRLIAYTVLIPGEPRSTGGIATNALANACSRLAQAVANDSQIEFHALVATSVTPLPISCPAQPSGLVKVQAMVILPSWPSATAPADASRRHWPAPSRAGPRG